MSNGKTYLGVDIGGTSVKLGLVDEQGVIRYSEAYDVAFDRYETPILKTVLKSMKLFLAEHEVTEQELAGIGVSATDGKWCCHRISRAYSKLGRKPDQRGDGKNVSSPDDGIERCQCGGSWRNVDRSCSRPSECYCNDGWDWCWRWNHCRF